MVNKNTGCMVCGMKIEAHNLCSLHYERQRRLGHFGSSRAADWGQRSKHPLYERWKGMLRQGGHAPEWQDFWKMVENVGEQPADHRLHRLRGDEPWGPTNFEWLPVIARYSNKNREEKNTYMREWRNRNHGRVRSYEMKRHRGVSIAEYDEMLVAQGGGCAICGENDQTFRLAIDHNHETGANRGLLCSNCNRALGLFKDSEKCLASAIRYLNRHRCEAA